MAQKPVTEYQIDRHGVDGSQYFPGHGLAYSNFDDCATGIGSTEAEALADALESLAQNGWDTSTIDDVLDDVIGAHDDCDEDDDDDCDLYYFVSVDVR